MVHYAPPSFSSSDTERKMAACFISCVAGKGCCAEISAGAKANGVAQSTSSLAMRKLCAAADAGGVAKSLLLPGASPEQRAEVDSWLDFAASFSEEHLPSLNQHLRGRSFLAGSSFSLADVAVYFACSPIVAAAAPAGEALDFSRWFNQVQHRVRLMVPSCKAIPPTVPLSIFSPVTVPLPAKRPPATTAAAAAPSTAGPPAPAAAAAATGEGEKPAKSSSLAGQGKKDKKKKKKEGGDCNSEGGAPDAAKKGAEPPAAAAAGGEAGGAAAAAAAEGEPSKLDVRVGVIVKAWEHPDSEKLFCEEIDLGEGTTRNIASGLRAFYTLEEMQGKRVIVLANLKARNIGGFKSNGMVLCASSADHSVVKIVEPPPGAAIGARVTVSGTEGEPATPAQVAKKKILEKCVPKLKTNSDGLPGYEGVGVFNVDGEPCVATIPGAFVS
ncbi:unnamed protein product [Pylaiella littoralis]